jgi:hypothetical protein
LSLISLATLPLSSFATPIPVDDFIAISAYFGERFSDNLKDTETGQKADIYPCYFKMQSQQGKLCPIANAIVNTVKPNASETPTKPMPNSGYPAAKTALPQPPKTNQNVPINSALSFFFNCMTFP